MVASGKVYAVKTDGTQARNLFDEIIYDLDQQRIVSFKLKTWAQQFLVLRGQLYEDGNRRSKCTPDRYRRVITTPDAAIVVVLDFLYDNGTEIQKMRQRKQEIRQLYAQGVPKTKIGRQYGISARRVRKIVDEGER